MKITRFILNNTALVTLLFAARTGWPQGALTPPGAPAPTMKSLDQVEPRTPISSLPYTINNPGTYYLTGNLTGTSGISIRASGVTLDLMGFELVGGTNSGISISASHTNTCIRNGTIRGWSLAGIDFDNSTNCQLIHLRLVGNGSSGAFAGDYAVVNDCVASGNQFDGIDAGTGSKVTDCMTHHNTGSGISVTQNALVHHCVSEDNGNSGIVTSSGCTVTDCLASECGSGGIICGNDSRVVGCKVQNNNGDGVLAEVQSLPAIRCTVRDCVCIGNGTSGLGASGISVGGDSVVSGCHASQNGNGSFNAGIHTSGSGSRIENNAVRDNNGWGILAGTGDIIVRNNAGNNSSGNYSPSSGANVGPIQSPNTATSPWANF